MLRTAPFATLLIALSATAPVCPAAPGGRNNGRSPSDPMNPEEIRAMVQRVIVNQHRNDDALAQFERREHRRVWKTEEQNHTQEDKLYRVVPTGTGTIKLVLAESGRATPPDEYRKQLRYLEQALVWALDPKESKQKHRVEKFEKRSRERADTVDAVAEAFLFTWLGSEMRDGRQLVKLGFDPNPAFRPDSRAEDLLSHASAIVWIDLAAAQVARVEAELVSDISFGGGLLGKVYKGGAFVMEQAPAEDGVWLPTRVRYDFRGRKFVFGFEVHEEVTSSHYRRIGPPNEALAAVRRELNNTPKASGSQ